jgi:peptidyl-tRNA hydrolase, PTH1 family
LLKIVVGLGNPGAKYTGTRHNVGFAVLDSLQTKFGNSAPKIGSDSKTSTIEINSTKVILLWPLTYMNLSGRSVQPLVNFYKIDTTKDLLVICDDLSLPLGKLRIKPKGSAGGQKGLADILQRLGDQQIPRLRIGIDPTPANWDTADYVLSKFRAEEQPTINQAVELAVEAIQNWCLHDLQYCMNRYNQASTA